MSYCHSMHFFERKKNTVHFSICFSGYLVIFFISKSARCHPSDITLASCPYYIVPLDAKMSNPFGQYLCHISWATPLLIMYFNHHDLNSNFGQKNIMDVKSYSVVAKKYILLFHSIKDPRFYLPLNYF